MKCADQIVYTAEGGSKRENLLTQLVPGQCWKRSFIQEFAKIKLLVERILKKNFNQKILKIKIPEIS